jgi:antitoxin component YwqK of YwqJK toxin-antitoxin module
VNGKRQGEFITKNDKGKIIRKANFKDGMQDGLEFTSSEGLLREYSQEVNYKKGKRHGVEKIFDKKGAIIKKTNYVNNLKHGDSIEFYPSGRVRCVNKYVKGYLRSWKDYKDEGSITRPL